MVIIIQLKHVYTTQITEPTKELLPKNTNKWWRDSYNMIILFSLRKHFYLYVCGIRCHFNISFHPAKQKCTLLLNDEKKLSQSIAFYSHYIAYISSKFNNNTWMMISPSIRIRKRTENAREWNKNKYTLTLLKYWLFGTTKYTFTFGAFIRKIFGNIWK